VSFKRVIYQSQSKLHILVGRG